MEGRKEGRKEGNQVNLQILLRLQAQTLSLWKQYVLDAVCCPIQYLSWISVFWVGLYYNTLERFFSTFITVGFAIGSWHLVKENLHYCLLLMLSFLLQILTRYVELQLLRGHLLNMKKRQCHASLPWVSAYHQTSGHMGNNKPWFGVTVSVACIQTHS